MQNWIKHLFRHWTRGADGFRARVLALESEARRLSLELQEREKQWRELQSEAEQRTQLAEGRMREAVQTVVERFVSEAASAVAQLTTQAHLIEAQGQAVDSKDVLAVATRFVRLFEDLGLERQLAVGQTVPFDPELHEPLSAEIAIPRGQLAAVRFVAISYRGKILRKAKVEAVA